MHREAADVVGVIQVESLPVVGGVVAHARPARVVYHLSTNTKEKGTHAGARERLPAQQRRLTNQCGTGGGGDGDKERCFDFAHAPTDRGQYFLTPWGAHDTCVHCCAPWSRNCLPTCGSHALNRYHRYKRRYDVRSISFGFSSRAWRLVCGFFFLRRIAA